MLVKKITILPKEYVIQRAELYLTHEKLSV